MDEIKKYFKDVAVKYPKVSLKQEVLSGMPTIVNRRINISLIISCFLDGMGIQEIAEDFELTREEIEQALKFVVDVLNKPYM